MTTTTANRIGRISHPSEVLPPPLPTFGGPRKGGECLILIFLPFPHLSLSIMGFRGEGGKGTVRGETKRNPPPFPQSE